jgi:uncharacterized repeat protein (TIGR04138 family)
MPKDVEHIARQDGRYSPNALRFVFDGLGKTIQKIRQETDIEEERHIAGDQLAMGLGDLACQQWGRLAKVVLNEWGIYTTRDFGEIVYLMIRNEWMRAQDEDRIEDFDDIYDFQKRFETNFRFELN